MPSKGCGSLAALAAALVVSLVAASPALADPYVLGDAANFAVLGFGAGFTNQLQPGALTVNGNVGVGTGGDATLGGANVVVTGQILYADPIVGGTNFTASGGPINLGTPASTCNSTATCLATGDVVTNNALVTSADTALTNMYSAVKSLAATAGSPTGAVTTFTWTGNGGTNVANISSISLSAGKTLTLNGTASDFFIFNITGGMSGSSSGNIVLGPGVSPDHVLFNLLQTADGGNGTGVSFSGNFTGFGIVLALDRNITEDTPGGGWTGRYFSDTNKTIHIFSEGDITQPSSPVPEPASLLLLGSGLVALGGLGRKWGIGRRTS